MTTATSDSELLGKKTALALRRDSMKTGSMLWYCVTFLLLAAFAFMYFDPWYGRGATSYSIAITSILIAFLTLTTLFYDARYFGKPRGGNLLAQVLAFLPFTLFVSRLFGSPAVISEEKKSLLRNILSLARRGFDFVIGVDLVPQIIQEILATPSLAITLLILISGTAIPKQRQWKTGWVLCAFLWPLWKAIASATPPSPHWWCGAVLMALALYLMLHDVDAHSRDYTLVRRLRHVNDTLEYQASVRICKEAMEDGEVTPEQVVMIVKSVYENPQGRSFEEIAQSLCMKLVTEQRLLVYVSGKDKVFEPSHQFGVAQSELSRILLFPRDVFIFAIAIAWWVSPFDLIPDMLPIIGFVDDMIILWVGATPIGRYLKVSSHRRSRLRDDSV